mmetsp:Transcript_66376/g.134795  ORF Transcript_66376/g.134795 Transcript_66376/m.134795 type:complete len:110 (+) Transcript_66376:76-405(+)
MAFQTDIKTSEEFKKEVMDTPGTLHVVELYQGWAGPCKAIFNTFKRIFFDAGDKPLKFYTLNVDSVGEGFEEYKGSCQPVFLFYKDGEVKEKVVGVQAPALSKHIAAMC